MSTTSRDTPTHREQLFAAAFLKHAGDAAAAAREAGYSDRTARQQGCRLLRRPRVMQAVLAATQDRVQRIEMDGDTVVRELAEIAFSRPDFSQIMEFRDGKAVPKPADQWPASTRYWLESAEFTRDGGVKVQLRDRDFALKMLAAHFNVCQARHRLEHTGRDGGPIAATASQTTKFITNPVTRQMLGELYDQISSDGEHLPA